MALLSLNLDTQLGKLVFSETQPTPFTLPEFFQEDSPTIEFKALKRVRLNSAPFYERTALTGYDLLISIGIAGTIYASAASWTASDSNTILTGRLDLNTASISALADNTEVTLEVRLFDGIGYYRAQQSCRVRKSVATTGTLQAVVNDIALGKREASRTYVPVSGCTGFTMVDEVDGTLMIVRLRGGSLLAEPIF